MKFFLIMFLAMQSGNSINTIQFSDQIACVNAGKLMAVTAKSMQMETRWFCVPAQAPRIAMKEKK